MLVAYGMALSPGTELHRYRLLEVLGVGGFGVTYLAEHVALSQRVAIKEYLPNEFAFREGTTVQPKSPTSQPAFEWGLERFLDEAKTLARFEHRNLVRVRDYFEANRTACMVMDYEEGEPLSELLYRCGSLPEDELKRLLLPLVDGLGAVHAAGFLHRDIKPSNICVRRSDGSPVLLDFGAARYALGQKSCSLTAIASAGYAPPEQYESDGHQGPWTDVYGLSALCYRAITGEVPTEATHRMHQLVQGKPDPLPRLAQEGRDEYSPELLAAVDRGLAVAASKRPRTLAEWVGAWSSGTESAKVGSAPGASRTAASRTALSGQSTSPDAAAEAGHLSKPARRSKRQARLIGWSAFAAALVVLIAVSMMVAVDEFSDNRALAELEALLERPPDPAAVDDNGMTDLHWAALQGNAKAAAWLLEQGAAVDAETKDRLVTRRFEQGEPVFEAVDPETGARLSRLGFLEEGGANQRRGGPALWWLVLELYPEDEDAVAERPVSVSLQPLMLAAVSSSPEVTELLLEHGADVDARDVGGRTSLHWAAYLDSFAVAELLLARGAEVDARDAGGGTPLHDAVIEDSFAVAELLLARGADVDARRGDFLGWTPLHWATQLDSVVVAELLLAHGAEVHARSGNGSTPLDLAAQEDSAAVAELLLAHGAGVDARDSERWTPLHWAAQKNSVAVAELLLAHGAEVHARMHNGSTPLDLAAQQRDSVAVAELLLAHGAAVDARDSERWTPLHEAARSGWAGVSVAMVELLLANRAEVNARNGSGLTPLDLAMDRGNEAAADILRRHGGVSGRRR